GTWFRIRCISCEILRHQDIVVIAKHDDGACKQFIGQINKGPVHLVAPFPLLLTEGRPSHRGPDHGQEARRIARSSARWFTAAPCPNHALSRRFASSLPRSCCTYSVTAL